MCEGLNHLEEKTYIICKFQIKVKPYIYPPYIYPLVHIILLTPIEASGLLVFLEVGHKIGTLKKSFMQCGWVVSIISLHFIVRIM